MEWQQTQIEKQGTPIIMKYQGTPFGLSFPTSFLSIILTNTDYQYWRTRLILFLFRQCLWLFYGSNPCSPTTITLNNESLWPNYHFFRDQDKALLWIHGQMDSARTASKESPLFLLIRWKSTSCFWHLLILWNLDYSRISLVSNHFPG